MQAGYVALTAISALLGALLFYRLRIPAGAMTGAVCGTVLFSALTANALMPYAAKFFAQVTAGAFIGCSVSREDFRALRGVLRPAAVVICSYLVLNLLTGTLLRCIAGLDILTAYLSAVPGGMSDVPLTAADMGADVSTVVVLQFVRLCSGLSLFPFLVSRIPQETAGDETKEGDTGSTNKSPAAVAVLLLAASCGGYLGRCLGIPAGVLLFSIFTALIFKLFIMPVKMSRTLKRLAQVLSGAYIGCSVTVDSLRAIPQLLLPAVLIVLLYICNAYVIGGILNRKFGISKRTAMLMMTPAGASDMALISSDLGVQSPTLLVIQLFRMLAASAVFPQICYLIAKSIGGAI